MKGKEKMKTNEVIYISGAISGTSDYMERFEKAEAFLKGWRESKGANREYGLAMGKEKIVIEEEDGDLIKSMLMR